MSRNYSLGVFNGTLARLGMSMLHPQLILAAFVYEQTGSNLLVGLLTAMVIAGDRLPQLHVSSLIEHRRSKKPFYILATALRVLSLGAMAGSVLLSMRFGGPWPIALFLTAFFAFRLGQGGAAMPFFDILAGAIGPQRVGHIFALRHFLGGILAFVVGLFLVQPVLLWIGTPLGYAVLIGAALLVLATAWTSFMFVSEQNNGASGRRRGFWELLREGLGKVRRDGNYRGLFLLHLLIHVNALGLAFYVPYGTERLGVVGLGGVFLGSVALSRVVSSLVWGRVSRRKGSRLCLLAAGLFFLVSPLAALLAPHLPEGFAWTVPRTDIVLDVPLLAYLGALCCFGFGLQANIVGIVGFVVETAPEERRPSHVAFLNTVAMPMAAVPALCGWLLSAGVLSLEALFGLVAAGGVAFLCVAHKLTEVRGEAPERAPA